MRRSFATPRMTRCPSSFLPAWLRVPTCRPGTRTSRSLVFWMPSCSIILALKPVTVMARSSELCSPRSPVTMISSMYLVSSAASAASPSSAAWAGSPNSMSATPSDAICENLFIFPSGKCFSRSNNIAAGSERTFVSDAVDMVNMNRVLFESVSAGLSPIFNGAVSHRRANFRVRHPRAVLALRYAQARFRPQPVVDHGTPAAGHCVPSGLRGGVERDGSWFAPTQCSGSEA